MKGKRKNFSPVGIVRDNSVPVLFIIICLIMIPLSGFSPSYVLNEVMTRLGRNSFMILSLLIPIMAGMGLNFGMTLGAMAGEIGLILVADWQIWGIPGLILAAIISIPISVLLGLMCGKILNRAKGREMITSYFIAFFMNGVYQLVVLYMMGPLIPIAHNSLKLPRGYGIRNTVSLLPMRQSIDNALAVFVGGVKIPVLTLIIIALACLFILWFRRTKLGHLLVEGAAAGGHVDGVYPLARFIADVLPAAVQGVGLHHRAPAAAVGIVVHLHLLVGGIVPDLVGGDGDIASLLCPTDDGLIHHGVDGVGEQRHNVNSHQRPVLSSCVPAPRPRRCPPTR